MFQMFPSWGLNRGSEWSSDFEKGTWEIDLLIIYNESRLRKDYVSVNNKHDREKIKKITDGTDARGRTQNGIGKSKGKNDAWINSLMPEESTGVTVSRIL